MHPSAWKSQFHLYVAWLDVDIISASCALDALSCPYTAWLHFRIISKASVFLPWMPYHTLAYKRHCPSVYWLTTLEKDTDWIHTLYSSIQWSSSRMHTTHTDLVPRQVSLSRNETYVTRWEMWYYFLDLKHSNLHNRNISRKKKQKKDLALFPSGRCLNFSLHYYTHLHSTSFLSHKHQFALIPDCHLQHGMFSIVSNTRVLLN